MNVLITGISSGLGYELAKKFIKKGDNVYGTSRRKISLDANHLQCDFNNLEELSLNFKTYVSTFFDEA